MIARRTGGSTYALPRRAARERRAWRSRALGAQHALAHDGQRRARAAAGPISAGVPVVAADRRSSGTGRRA